jgi:isocitrate dehydrogenase (NAD+)
MGHVKAAIRCVRAPVDFEDIPLSSNVASDEMFERAITAVKRNGIALKG